MKPAPSDSLLSRRLSPAEAASGLRGEAVLTAIGNTPLLRLDALVRDRPCAHLWGKAGIAYAMLGAALGFPVTLCVPENASPERKRILQAYGANIIYTDPAEGSDGALKIARQLAERHPDLYFYADQYSNDANWRAHYETTANEIWQQTEGRITHFVAMLGTTGTFVGTTRRLKELNPKIRCISLQPDSAFHGIEGAKHLPSA